ncbi:MFS transporter [Arthrobacter crystallopoietes]|uniref:MFS transporter n=1 Tax=Crystallibacter crystallopoietes TaxID=37928 RepID=UPI0011113DAF|nr:MFS transporter [Arthrobacter crystallopoietes]
MMMPSPPALADAARTRKRAGLHRAWLVAAVTLLALVAAAAFRSTTGALFAPIEGEFGWTRTQLSGAVTANLIVYGLVAPFAAVLMERFSLRAVAAGALGLVAAGSGLTLVMTEIWQLWVLWGGFVGVGTGAMALVFGAVVANRWFVKHRGLVMGMFSAANACGQLVFLPAIVHLSSNHGWRVASLLVTAFALAIIPLLFWPFADTPAKAGTTPYGAESDTTTASAPASPTARRRGAAAETLHVLGHAIRFRAFWILVFTFWVCGWSTNGLIQTHFIPAAHDHGMPATTASGLLALIGVFDVIGTVASGWLTDRVRPWILLVIYYGLRGFSLLTVHALLGPSVEAVLWIFIVFYGLDWVATVPPTVALCREHFGIERSSVVFGWVFASHMVGAGIGALTAGIGRDIAGSYLPAWITAAALCFLAAASLFLLPRKTATTATPEPREEETS